jgi:hypothetical protein
MAISTLEVYAYLGNDATFLDNQWTYYPGILITNWLPRNIHPQLSHWEKFRVSVFSILSVQIHGHSLILKYNSTVCVPRANKSVWKLCVQFLFTYLCFTDMIIAGYQVFVWVYWEKKYVFYNATCSTYLTFNVIPQWFNPLRHLTY